MIRLKKATDYYNFCDILINPDCISHIEERSDRGTPIGSIVHMKNGDIIIVKETPQDIITKM